MTPEKQVIPAEDLTRNTENPISCVLFGPSGRESDTRNLVKPGITQITSFKIAVILEIFGLGKQVEGHLQIWYGVRYR